MSTKQTGGLQVLTDQSFSEKKLVIIPNDGFDLGLMMTEATVELLFTSSPGQVQNDQEHSHLQAMLIQKNECQLGTIELGPKSIKKLNGNTRVRLFLEEKDGNPKLWIGPV